MKTRVTFVALSFFLIASTLVAAAAAQVSPPYAKGELLLALRDQAPLVLESDGSLAATRTDVADVLARHGLDRFEFLVRGKRELSERDRRYIRVRTDIETFDAVEATRELTALGVFRAVSPNYHLQFFGSPSLVPSANPLATPNDPALGQQWHLAAGGGTGAAGVALPAAWDVETGDPSVVIAVMDSGVDVSHPDLASNIWNNPGEVAGNAMDDDGNGYVDDVMGWDFGEDDADPSPVPLADPLLGLDVGWHGTHVAGIAAAVTNNGVGIAGAAWNCRIMPIKVTNAQGEFLKDALAGSFLYAADMGADVLNMSFGGPDVDGLGAFTQALVDDVTAAGVLCVAAAGNDGGSALTYPAAATNVLAVGATDGTNARASFSNFGSWVDVAAPGAQIWSTIMTNYQMDVLSALFYTLLSGYDGVSPYMLSDGTSMAAPLVAGICALVRSRFPSMSPQQVAQRLVDTGDAVAYDQPIGPKVNAYQALVDPTATEDRHPVLLQVAGAHPNPFNPSTEIVFSTGRRGRVTVAIYSLRGERVRTVWEGELEAGDHRTRWDGRDDTGMPVASAQYLYRVRVLDEVRTGKLSLVK